MENHQYLPSEVINYTNFPELRKYKKSIEAVQTYAMRVNDAVTGYNSGKYNRIDLNASELLSNIDLCRSICGVLGASTNVCYDVLFVLREIQTTLQNILYLNTAYGDLYVGTPSATSSDGRSGI